MTTPSWLADYNSALRARDLREKAQERYINAFTKLADRTARLEADAAAAPAPQPPAQSAPAQPTKSKASPSRFGRSSPATVPEPEPTDALARLRADLAATQTSRAQLQAQLSTVTADLASWRTRATKDEKAVVELKREKAALERKLRDRESEVKGKTRLVEEVQDELVSLNLQFNMAEQKADKLEKENKELIDRWVKYKEKEAERMNDLSKWE